MKTFLMKLLNGAYAIHIIVIGVVITLLGIVLDSLNLLDSVFGITFEMIAFVLFGGGLALVVGSLLVISVINTVKSIFKKD